MEYFIDMRAAMRECDGRQIQAIDLSRVLDFRREDDEIEVTSVAISRNLHCQLYLRGCAAIPVYGFGAVRALTDRPVIRRGAAIPDHVALEATCFDLAGMELFAGELRPWFEWRTGDGAILKQSRSILASAAEEEALLRTWTAMAGYIAPIRPATTSEASYEAVGQ